MVQSVSQRVYRLGVQAQSCTLAPEAASLSSHQQLLPRCQEAKGAGDVSVDPQELPPHNIGFEQRHEGAHAGNLTQQALSRQEASMQLTCGHGRTGGKHQQP